MNKIVLVVLLLLAPRGLLGLELYLRKETSTLFYIEAILDQGESVCKDSIKISSNDPSIVVLSYEVLDDPVEEYVAPLKFNKKIYTDSFVTKVVLKKACKQACNTHLFFACFLMHYDESVVPVSHMFALPYNRVKTHVRVVSGDVAEPVQKKRRWFFSIRFLLLLFLLLLFIGFICMNVLEVIDLCMLALLLFCGCIAYYMQSVWGYMIHAGIMTLGATWFFTHRSGVSLYLARVRLICGLLCASLFLPFFLSALVGLFL